MNESRKSDSRIGGHAYSEIILDQVPHMTEDDLRRSKVAPPVDLSPNCATTTQSHGTNTSSNSSTDSCSYQQVLPSGKMTPKKPPTFRGRFMGLFDR